MRALLYFAIQASCLVAANSLQTTFISGNVVAPCNSTIFCHGPLLRDVQLARPFADSKTFVDLPTIRPVSQVLESYNQLKKPLSNDTALQTFLAQNFGEVGLEIGELNETLIAEPSFLDHVNSPIVKDFVRQVIGIWPLLSRAVVNETLCTGCESSFLAPKRPFVVAGGRFREVYYWDSYFILEGLLRSSGNYTVLAKNTIENFLDFIETYGFVPNGARKYYLNRSQPPLLCDMVNIYMKNTNDTSILAKAIPLLVKEQAYWDNQTVTLTRNGTKLTVFRYSVLNNQPRPESYLEDYQTVNNQTYFASDGTTYQSSSLTTVAQESLYANLASGAETGWDYSSRWLKTPLVAAEGTGIPLRSLNTGNIIPVDLQSIQYSNAKRLSEFHDLVNDKTESEAWLNIANTRAETLQRVHYNATLKGYFDYNLTSGTQNTHIPSSAFNATLQQFFSPSQFYPLAFNASPPEILSNSSLVMELYQPVITQLSQFPGGVAATNFKTGQQWDSPNVWAPLQYFLIQGLLNALDLIPKNDDSGREKVHALAVLIAQRFIDSSYCTWRSTGGSHPSLDIPALPNLPQKSTTTGTIFEKYSNQAIDAVGGGGEYSVVPGFGWSNGVIIWLSDGFGEELRTPECRNRTMSSS